MVVTCFSILNWGRERMLLTELPCAEERHVSLSIMNGVTTVCIPSKIFPSVLDTVLERRIKIDFVAGIK